MNLTARVTPSNEVLHCIDHLALDVRDGHQMTWSGNDDLAKVVAWIDDVLNVLDATPKPIVWDGSDESSAAIAVTLPIGSRVGRSPTNNKLPMHIFLGYGDPVSVPVGWRIQQFGDSFVILPPDAILPPEATS